MMNTIRAAACCAASCAVLAAVAAAGVASADPTSSTLWPGATLLAVHHETSQIVRVDGVGLAALTRAVAVVSAAHPAVVVRSYPFASPAGVAANIVVRGRRAAMVEATATELATSLTAASRTRVARLDD